MRESEIEREREKRKRERKEKERGERERETTKIPLHNNLPTSVFINQPIYILINKSHDDNIPK